MTGRVSVAPGTLVATDANNLYRAILLASRIITDARSIQQVYEKFALELKELVDFDQANVTTVDAASGDCTIAYSFGQQLPGFPAGQVIPMDRSRAGLVIVTGEPFIEHDMATAEPRRALDAAALSVGLRSSIDVPLVCQGQVFGALSIRSRQVAAFGPREEFVIDHLARLMAPAVDRIGLSERMSRLTGGSTAGRTRRTRSQATSAQISESDAGAALSTSTMGQELSPREREVLGLLTSGAENREIAAALSISPNTVKTHVRKILGKLKARNRTEAAMAGRVEGVQGRG